ncbi:flagellar motor switch protein FliN [Allorhizobium sp. BGMRC 0089]|uniref:flagellar motor switch protein FliN n=1 Tax=Allorhizobium sonneratiae TaxID=2934936 RepID=UPI0020343351|nr:flagellar motor switch protein FliN [Allorhizobium sonneratiae]MCM2291409.1 flagellar motor switch protein FliN [Allorhizobium sonneratiae]
MATKKTPTPDLDPLDISAGENDLDQAIDNLRGVLKSDSDGTMPDMGSDFGSDIGGDFGEATSGGLSGMDTDFAASSGSDFGGGDFGSSDFGGAMGGSDFGGDSFSSAATPAPGSALNANLDMIMDIPIDVQIVLGSSRMQVSALMNLEEGAIIALDKKIGEPVEIMVNGRRIARGEITVLENDDTRFGVKLIEVMGSKAS